MEDAALLLSALCELPPRHPLPLSPFHTEEDGRAYDPAAFGGLDCVLDLLLAPTEPTTALRPNLPPQAGGELTFTEVDAGELAACWGAGVTTGGSLRAAPPAWEDRLVHKGRAGAGAAACLRCRRSRRSLRATPRRQRRGRALPPLG